MACLYSLADNSTHPRKGECEDQQESILIPHAHTHIVCESAVMLANIPVVHCKQLIGNLYAICRQFDCEWYLHPSASNTFLALAQLPLAFSGNFQFAK